MSTNDIRSVPYISPASEGSKPASQISVQAAIQTLAEMIHKLEGRMGETALRDDLTVDGDIVGDSVSIDTVTVGDKLVMDERPLEADASTAPDLSDAGQGVLYFDRTSNTFKVSQNGGAFENLIKSSTIIPHGRWRKSSATVGVGSYNWDVEEENVGSGFTRQASDTQIAVNFTGPVLVLAHPLLQSLTTDGAVELYHNTTKKAIGYGHAGSVSGFATCFIGMVLNMTSGDYIEIKNTQGDRYGAAAPYTYLTMTRVPTFWS